MKGDDQHIGVDLQKIGKSMTPPSSAKEDGGEKQSVTIRSP